MGAFAGFCKWIYNSFRVPIETEYDLGRDDFLARAVCVFEESDAGKLAELAKDVRLVRVAKALQKNELRDLADLVDRKFKRGMWDTFLPLTVFTIAFFLSWPARFGPGLIFSALTLIFSFIGMYELFDAFRSTFKLRNDYEQKEVKALKDAASELRKLEPESDSFSEMLSPRFLDPISDKTEARHLDKEGAESEENDPS